jgi:hypothetical protein
MGRTQRRIGAKPRDNGCVEFQFADVDGLARELARHDFAPEAYSLRGGHPDDGYGLDKRDSKWVVYRSLSGIETDLREFGDEQDACIELLDRIVRDPTTRPEARG